jgi:hypothetical protein
MDAVGATIVAMIRDNNLRPESRLLAQWRGIRKQAEMATKAGIGDDAKSWSAWERRTVKGASTNDSAFSTDSLLPLVEALGVPGATPALKMARFYLGPNPTADDLATLALPHQAVIGLALQANKVRTKSLDVAHEDAQAERRALDALAQPKPGRGRGTAR